MSDDITKSKIDTVRFMIKDNQQKYDDKQSDSDEVSWSAVSCSNGLKGGNKKEESIIDFIGKNLENGKFAGENLENANFSVSNLSNVDFAGADLRGVDFSGANLSGADLSGADLTGAIFTGAVLHNTNFSGAKMHGVKLTEADLENAILSGIDIDQLGIEELQQLIEYIAKYYPHKLNLSKINLQLLDLKKIDLSKLNLKGVDFTGCDFTGINILELDLSECIITPEQIAQALGRVPGAQEMARIMAPKKKANKKMNGIDMNALFMGDGKEFGVWDFAKDKGISIEKLLKVGKKIFRNGAQKPQIKDEKALEEVKSDRENAVKNHNDDLRKIIEERKQKELEARKQKKQELQKDVEKNNNIRREINQNMINKGRDSR